MGTIESAQYFLDQQAGVAIWYAEYEGRDESISYANPCFSEAFGMPVDEVLEKKRYRLVNPPDTGEEVIEQYKGEDLEAIREGLFFSRTPFDAGKEIEVIKLRFDRGILGLFKVVDSELGEAKSAWQDMDTEMLKIVQTTRPDLMK